MKSKEHLGEYKIEYRNKTVLTDSHHFQYQQPVVTKNKSLIDILFQENEKRTAISSTMFSSGPAAHLGLTLVMKIKMNPRCKSKVNNMRLQDFFTNF